MEIIIFIMEIVIQTQKNLKLNNYNNYIINMDLFNLIIMNHKNINKLDYR